MSNAIEEKNKALVLKAFDTLFNKRDYLAESQQPQQPHTSGTAQKKLHDNVDST